MIDESNVSVIIMYVTGKRDRDDDESMTDNVQSILPPRKTDDGNMGVCVCV